MTASLLLALLLAFPSLILFLLPRVMNPISSPNRRRDDLVVEKKTLFSELRARRFVTTHDAATGYMRYDRYGVVKRWTITQKNSNFTRQLECGARAFDIRVIFFGRDEGGPPAMRLHHGGVMIDQVEVESALREIKEWSARPGNEAEYVVAIFSHFVTDARHKGDAVMAEGKQELRSLLRSLGFVVYEDSKQAVDTKAIAIIEGDIALQWNWRENMVCTTTQYSCHLGSPTREIPFARMYDYLQETLSRYADDRGTLFAVQALWQASLAASVVIGALELSSIIEDEEKSRLNDEVSGWLRESSSLRRAFHERELFEPRRAALNPAAVNFLEVNNVCDGGQEIAMALAGVRSSSV